jgi:hypothetical protein
VRDDPFERCAFSIDSEQMYLRGAFAIVGSGESSASSDEKDDDNRFFAS